MLQINEKYYDLVSFIYTYGKWETCRKYTTKELLVNSSVIPMNSPLVTLTKRNLGYRFALAEAAWVLSGDNKLETILPYSKMINNFSDDGHTFFGAYGPPIVDQLEYIGRAFKKDLFTRQAVLTIWRKKPPNSADIPCTISVQFIIRSNNDELTLHLIDSMRSSDAWLGVPYDWFTFSMLGAYVAIYLENILKINIKLGNLYMIAGSQHLYKNGFGYSDLTTEHFLESPSEESFTYKPINLGEFKKPTDLTNHLWNLARGGSNIYSNWLAELLTYWKKGATVCE